MKTTRTTTARLILTAGAAALCALTAAPNARSANGIWTQTASGNLWDTTGNWAVGIVADGAAFTADFSALDITGDNVVHLDSAHTIGSLLFGDTDPIIDFFTVARWLLDSNGNAANTLTLAGVGLPGSEVGIVVNAAAVSVTPDITLSNNQTWTINGLDVVPGILPASLMVGTLSNGANHLTLESSTRFFNFASRTAITSFNGGTGGLTVLNSANLEITTATLTGDQTWTVDAYGYFPDGPFGIGLPAVMVGTLSNGANHLTLDSGGASFLPDPGARTAITSFNGGTGGLSVFDRANLEITTATLTGDQTWTVNARGYLREGFHYGILPTVMVGTLSNGANHLTLDSNPFQSDDGSRTAITSFNGGTGGLSVINAANLEITTATLTGNQTWTVNARAYLHYGSPFFGILPAVMVGTLSNGANHLTLDSDSNQFYSGDGSRTAITSFNGGTGGLSVINGANLEITTATLTGDQTWTVNAYGYSPDGTFGLILPAVMVGTVTNGGFMLTVDGTGDTAITGTIGGTGGLTKTGGGTLTLEAGAVGSYTGETTVGAGRLLVNGAKTGTGAVSVDSGAKLGGTGSVAGAVNVSGILSPGASVETLATGALTLNNGSTFEYEVDSSVANSVGADLQTATGNLTLNGTVALTMDDLAAVEAAYAFGTTFSLINYTGTWNGGFFTYGGNELGNNEQFTAGLNIWEIVYDAADGGVNFSGEYAGGPDRFVNITAAPEPASAMLLLGGTALLALRRRR